MLSGWSLRRNPPRESRSGFVYIRLDDRLIHGQVVIGWGTLNVDCLILANDRVAADPSESEYYRAVISEEMGGTVETLAEVVERTEARCRSKSKCMIVVASVADLLDLVEKGLRPDLLILGGLRSGADRKRLLDYLYLSDSEIEELLSLVKRGIPVVCQDLPTSERIPFAEALARSHGSHLP